MEGIIIKQSLSDPKILEGFKILEHERDDEVDWDLYTVEATEAQVKQLANEIKDKWYTHFWQGREVIAVFRGKIFKFNFDDKENWKPAVDYGMSIGIPKEQLDFPIDS